MKAPCECGIAGPLKVENPIFISDLHLAGNKKKAILHFWWFLETKALRYRELFVLGDFFEYWLGDDYSKPAAIIAAMLRRYARRGHKVYLMQGNRDFMLGDDFPASFGAQLVKPQTVIEHRGTKILLAHGDEWCLRDPEYQKVRAMLRDKTWQENALKLSIPERIEFAKSARSESGKVKKQKTLLEMDVVDEAVLEDAKKFGCAHVIHGHTHRPAEHVIGRNEDGSPVMRVVISDWELSGNVPKRKGWVVLDENSVPRTITV